MTGGNVFRSENKLGNGTGLDGMMGAKVLMRHFLQCCNMSSLSQHFATESLQKAQSSARAGVPKGGCSEAKEFRHAPEISVNSSRRERPFGLNRMKVCFCPKTTD